MEKVSYPFTSKRQIVARLATDDEFVVECLGILQARQTAYEQETLTTVVRNRAGWMSSHAVNMGKLVAKIASGETPDVEDFEKGREACSHYGRQLAAHFRQEALQKDPGLADAARVFGVSA